jgi:hypothetical protein
VKALVIRLPCPSATGGSTKKRFPVSSQSPPVKPACEAHKKAMLS